MFVLWNQEVQSSKKEVCIISELFAMNMIPKLPAKGLNKTSAELLGKLYLIGFFILLNNNYVLNQPKNQFFGLK